MSNSVKHFISIVNKSRPIISFKTFYCRALIPFFLIVSCARAIEEYTSGTGIPEIKFSKTGTTAIDDWAVVGPFEGASGKSLERDQHDIPSEALTNGIEHLEGFLNDHFGAYRRSVKKTRFLRRTQTDIYLDLQSMFERPYSADNPASWALAICSVTTEHDEDPILMTRTGNFERIWVNGLDTEKLTQKRGINKYQTCLKIHLNKGRNLLAIQVASQSSLLWGLSASLASSSSDATSLALSIQRHIGAELLNKIILKPEDSLILQPTGVPVGALVQFHISQPFQPTPEFDELLATGEPWIPLHRLNAGVYQANLTFSGQSYSQLFCVGDPTEVEKEALRQADQAPAGKEDIQLQTLVRRAKSILVSRFSQEPGNWDGKMVFALAELKQYIEKKNASVQKEGLHLRGFVSKIDQQIFHYRLFVPSKYANTGEPMPLVVLLPTPLEKPRAFLESPFLAYQNEADGFCDLAERFQVSILWCGYRSQPSGAPCDFTHITEVIDDVRRNYHINESKVSLLAICSGAAFSVMIANQNPGRFSAIALMNPVFSIRHSTESSPKEFQLYAEFRDWFFQSSAAKDKFLAEQSVPTFIIYDGSNPDHGTLLDSATFADAAKKRGRPVTLNIETQPLEKHFYTWERLIEWSSKQDLALQPNSPRSSGMTKSDTSIAQALSQPTIFVRPTGGTDAERRSSDTLVEGFAKTWRKQHFVDCTIVDDVSLKVDSFPEANLLLLGNPELNSLWHSLASEIPLSLASDHIGFDGKEFKGKHLFAEVNIPRPGFPSRRLVLIGANDLSGIKNPFLALSTEGWFTYSIWSFSDEQGRLLQAGVSPK